MLSTNYDKNLGTKQKALRINLDKEIYGSFAEIGAGQDVAANFFRSGGASGTIAKTMSAYDMTFSDAIYGPEESGRYVVESRMLKMITHEYNLLKQRLSEKRGSTTTFFAFADTVVALNYQKNNDPHGWIGLRFQLEPNGEYNDVIIHVRMLDNDNILQQQAIGIIGVNLIYGCYYYNKSAETLLVSLMDDLEGRIEIDMVRFDGPDFKQVDNRLMSLYLVKYGFTNAAIFGPDGNVMQPSEVLYKKHIVTLRGRFRPVTYVNLDMLKNGVEQFLEDPEVNPDKVMILSEITLHDLMAGNKDIDEQDFLDRADLLSALGQTVMISNYQEYYKLVSYLSKFSKLKMALILGIGNLEYIFEEKHYETLSGGILESFATLFSRNVKLLVYPMLRKDGSVYTCQHFNLPAHQVDLFQYLLANDKLEDIRAYHRDLMHIISDNVLAMIKQGQEGWEEFVPIEVSSQIKEKRLFEYYVEGDNATENQHYEVHYTSDYSPVFKQKDEGIGKPYFGG